MSLNKKEIALLSDRIADKLYGNYVHEKFIGQAITETEAEDFATPEFTQMKEASPADRLKSLNSRTKQIDDALAKVARNHTKLDNKFKKRYSELTLNQKTGYKRLRDTEKELKVLAQSIIRLEKRVLKLEKEKDVLDKMVRRNKKMRTSIKAMESLWMNFCAAVGYPVSSFKQISSSMKSWIKEHKSGHTKLNDKHLISSN